MAALDGPVADYFAAPVHCLSEFYNIATRSVIRGGSGMPAADAYAATAQYAVMIEILGLGVDQHLEAIRQFAAGGRTGAQLYDFLIGQVAVLHNISTIVTWNVKHMAALFPQLRVVKPSDL